MQTGLDKLARSEKLRAKLRGSKVGVLAHPASVDANMVHIRTILRAIDVKPAVLFGPEHGYGGEAQDMIGVGDASDSDGVPIRSLYGARYEDLIPSEKDIAGLDVLLVDLQDIGTRFYTFQWTVVLAMRVCAKLGVRVMVLDRPNPIGGDVSSLEGRMQKERYRSFVGLEPIAVRTALSYGEVAAWRAEVEGVAPGLLEIVPYEGIDRAAHAPAWDRDFVLPSPNMPTYETALVYPGGCLIEGTNLSEGRGVTRPFEIVGAPWVDGAKLADGLHALELPGMRARATTFRPTFHKHGGKICGGVQIHVTDEAAFRPVATYVALTALAHAQDAERFRFRTELYEYGDDIPAFDLLTGSADARLAIERGEDARAIAMAASEPDPMWGEAIGEAMAAAKRAAIG